MQGASPASRYRWDLRPEGRVGRLGHYLGVNKTTCVSLLGMVTLGTSVWETLVYAHGYRALNHTARGVPFT